MKVFVINLKKNKERLSRISARLSELNVPFERVDAVCGRDLTEKEKKERVNYFRWWCTKGYRIRDGEIGCTSSHNLIYARIAEEKMPFACILEDDAVLSGLFPSQLSNVETFLRKRIDEASVVLLSNHNGALIPDWEIRQIDNASFAEAYVINLKGARAYLAANSPMCAPVDMWGYWQQKGVFKLYQAYPGVCEQDWSPGFISDVCPQGSFDAKALPPIERVFWKIKRGIGKMIDKILY